MTLILAIDPGPVESAYVYYDTATRRPTFWTKQQNDRVGREIEMNYGFDDHVLDDCVIEMVASYGMPVGAEVFETCVWIGRFMELWVPWHNTEAKRIFRLAVKLHLCGDSRAKDANIRQALIDRFGGKEKAIGRKASPGPLYGMTGDCWSALAVAITTAETDVSR